MKDYMIYVCDDMGERVYSKKVQANSLKEAENMAYRWSIEVEADEGWLACYEAEEIK